MYRFYHKLILELTNKNKIIREKFKENETVPEKVRKLIEGKAKRNNHNLSLSSKLNLDTNLSLSEDNENKNDIINNLIQKNINLSNNAIFTIYNNNNKPIILAFDIENKAFSYQEFSDFNNFQENFQISEKNGNIFMTVEKNLYIITGKNFDMLYMYDSEKKKMNKLCGLKNNHSNGNLLLYDNNIICLSGDYNKKVEIYSINKNEWNILPEINIERSNSTSCIINNKYIITLFGYNNPSKEYLNSIEYLNINDKDSFWNYLKYSNQNLINLYLSNSFCINYDEKKIIIIGGYNGKENKYNDKFIQIIFDNDFDCCKNSNQNIIIEESERKLKDININKKYLFNNNGYRKICKNNEIFHEIFDSNYNCHLFQTSNMSQDIYYFHS